MDNLITIGFNKNGEADFGVNCAIQDLSLEKLKEIKEIIPVTIFIAEDMWRRANIISPNKIKENGQE